MKRMSETQMICEMICGWSVTFLCVILIIVVTNIAAMHQNGHMEPKSRRNRLIAAYVVAVGLVALVTYSILTISSPL